jgi:hypothetical protein
MGPAVQQSGISGSALSSIPARPPGVLNTNGYVPTDDQVLEAQQYVKYALSALQFEDVNSAVKNLKLSYALLAGETKL